MAHPKHLSRGECTARGFVISYLVSVLEVRDDDSTTSYMRVVLAMQTMQAMRAANADSFCCRCRQFVMPMRCACRRFVLPMQTICAADADSFCCRCRRFMLLMQSNDLCC